MNQLFSAKQNTPHTQNCENKIANKLFFWTSSLERIKNLEQPV